MKLNISEHHFVELIKKSYSLDHVYLLKMVEQQQDLSEFRKESMKFDSMYFSLIRKGLITEDEKLTIQGIELLKFIESKERKKIVKHKASVQEFEDWWKAFPGTDTFTHKGKSFRGSRTLRQAKDDCKVKFNKILLEGEYTSEQLIKALEYDVLQKKEMSVIQNTNKLTYMQNSLTYLNQRSYEAFIELIEQGIEIKESQKPTGTTDI